VISQSELDASFTARSDREADDKVPVVGGLGHSSPPRFASEFREAKESSMPFASLTGLRTRMRDRVDNAARGSDVPAGIDRGADAVAPSGSRERGRMRRRLRELRRLREAQLLELGALVLEAHRHNRDDSPVVKSKAAEAAATDAEARTLAQALDTDGGLDNIIASGIAGPCPTCGTLASTAARFCSTCGTPLDGRPGAAARLDATAAPTPLLDAREDDGRGTRSADGDAPTTELHSGNGNGSSPEEIEATSGQES
jgi:hypothetical protein